MGKKTVINLSKKEKDYLLELSSKGKHSATTIKNSLILLKSDDGVSNEEISKVLNVNIRKIQRVRKKYKEKGLKDAIFRKKRKDANKTKLDGKQEARLIQIACSNPPDGYSKWSLRMLSNKMVELEIVDSLSHETVRRTLKKTNLNHILKNNG